MSNDVPTPTTTTTLATFIEPLSADSIFSIDLRNFSQTELLALTRSSHFTPPPSQPQILTPKIDRSVFNESAGGRKQTYSRIRIASPESSKPRPPVTAMMGRGDLEDEDNAKIIEAFKGLFNMNGGGGSRSSGEGGSTDSWVPVKVSYDGVVPEWDQSAWVDVCVEVFNGTDSGERVLGEGSGLGSQVLGEGGVKRKRGRPRKDESVGKDLVVYEAGRNEAELNGGVGDLEDPYCEVLRARTVGLESEQDLLRVLTGFVGDWVDWTMQSKIVDASLLGEGLPRGWKILVGLERNDGRNLLRCQEYISPDGRRFQSWKESSLSYELQLPQAGCGETSHNAMTGVLESARILRCHKCTMTFNEEGGLLTHISSSHKKDSKRSRSEYSKCGAAIMIEGRYECQICRKLFEEKKRFDGHFGNHIKDYLKTFAPSLGDGNVQIDTVHISDSPDGSKTREGLNFEQHTSSTVDAIFLDKSHLEPPEVMVDESMGTGASPEKQIHETFMCSKDIRTTKAEADIRNIWKDDVNEISASNWRMHGQESGSENSIQALNKQISPSDAKKIVDHMLEDTKKKKNFENDFKCSAGVVRACAHDNNSASGEVFRLQNADIGKNNDEMVGSRINDIITHLRTGHDNLPLSETIPIKGPQEFAWTNQKLGNVLGSKDPTLGVRGDTEYNSVIEQTSSHLGQLKTMSPNPEK